MKAIVIPSATDYTLNPLLYNCNISHLPVMGTPIQMHRRRFLASNNIDISAEEIPHITDSDIVAIEENLLTSADLSHALFEHHRLRADITVILRNSSDPSNCSSILLDKHNFITGISENYTSVPLETEGIYILSKDAISAILKTDPDINGEKIINLGFSSSLNMLGFISNKYSISISSISDYHKAHNDVLNGTLPLNFSATQIKPGFFVESGVDISSGVTIETPVYISAGSHIERGAKIGGGTFISKNCTIKSGTSISRSIIGNECCICESCQIDGTILSSGINIGKDTKIMENSVIGYGCRIEPECTINPNIRIWPNKRVLKGTRLNDNLIYGSIGTEKLFTDGKICGEINVEITPEFMAKLGCALGTLFHNKKIGVGSDSSPACSHLASAVIAGLVSSGARVFDFGEQSLPMTRIATSQYLLDTSIHIKSETTDGVPCPEIEFIEPDGSSYSHAFEKRLENTFFNNIFLRAEPKFLHDIVKLDGYKMLYIQEMLNSIKSRSFNKNMELRTRSEGISDILEILLYDIELITPQSTKKEFSATISKDGQQIIIFSSNGTPLNNNQILYIISMILLKHLNAETIVLPVSASSQLEELLKGESCKIINCSASTQEFMKTLLKNKLYQQFRLCFDGIYFAVTLLDFLNHSNLSFTALLEGLPPCIYKETEIECPDSKKAKIIEKLYSKYGSSNISVSDGIKIYQTGGWVLVLPEKYRHYIKIITEAETMEAAEEISGIFTNKIKKLAKPQ